MTVNFDNYSLIIDGKRTFIKSSAFHYFRNPDEKVWYDRLSKIKAAGYNTVDLYFNWAYHSDKEGCYDFTGKKDIRKLLHIAKELELYVTARPGPYINAEVSGGGLPFWLFNRDDLVIRCRSGFEFQYSEKFISLVKDWYFQIIEILKNYNNIILFQVENEFSSDEAEPEYIQELYNIVKETGINVPIFHNDPFYAGLYADIVDIYAVDAYPTINISNDWRQFPEQFEVLDNLEEMIRLYTETSPLFISELQAGWFDKWNGIGYDKIRELFAEKHINIITKSALSQGVTLLNHYLGVGGTSWGCLPCDEVYSSYDFAASISEEGLLGENYFKAKEINYFLNAFNLSETEAVSVQYTFICENSEKLYHKLRKDNLNNSHWLFLRNLNDKVEIITFKNYEFAIDSYEMKILPLGLNLNACKIAFSSLEIFGAIRTDENYETIFFMADKGGFIEVSDYDDFDSRNFPFTTIDDKLQLIIEDNSTDLKTFEFKKGNKITKITVLPAEMVKYSWIINDKLVIGPELVTSNNQVIGIEKNKELIVLDTASDIKKNVNLTVSECNFPNSLIENWEVKKIIPELDNNYNFVDWQNINDNSFDCIKNNIYDEFIIYKGNYDGILKSCEFIAKHNIIIFLNGKRIFENYSLNQEETISFDLDESVQYSDKQNEITLLVQNLGFDKGFNLDVNSPRGLLIFDTIPQNKIEWKIKGINHFELNSNEGQAFKFSAKFNAPEVLNKFCPLVLKFIDLPFQNLSIYFNGIKIAQYIKEFSPQPYFYLPEEFLTVNNKIELLIIPTNHEYQHLKDYNSAKMNVNIKIEPIRCYELISITELLES